MTVRPSLALDPAAFVRPVARVAWVAKLLDCDESDIRKMVRCGQLEAHMKGKRGIRIYLDSVAAYQELRPIEPTKGWNGRRQIKAQRTAISRAAHAAAEAELRKSGILS